MLCENFVSALTPFLDMILASVEKYPTAITMKTGKIIVDIVCIFRKFPTRK